MAAAVREAVGALRRAPSHERRPSGVALVGLGYWGPHFARIAFEHADAELVWCCDRSEEALELPKRRYPQVRPHHRLPGRPGRRRRSRPSVIATPTATHADLAVAALEAGKHVLVEKPLAASSEEIDRIEAARGDRVVMVGHTFVYNTAIAAIRDLVASGDLGPRSVRGQRPRRARPDPPGRERALGPRRT